MDIVIALILIIFILLFLGFSIEFIIMAVCAIFLIILAVSGIALIICTVISLTAEKTTARFSKIDMDSSNSFRCAYYKIGETQYQNIFPAEVLFKDKIYNPEKDVALRLSKKINRVFDKNAFVTCIVGSIAFLAIIFTIIFLYIQTI